MEMETNVTYKENGKQYNKWHNEIMSCELCGNPTTTKTRRCDRCWELETRIQRDVELSRKILAQIKE